MNRGQEKWLENARRLGESETVLRAQLVVARLEELRALCRASQAARDIGDTLEAGRLSYLLVRHIPDWVVTAQEIQDMVSGWVAASADEEAPPEEQDTYRLGPRFRTLTKEIRHYPDQMTGTIRQAGLEPDPRFPLPAW